MNCWCWIPSSPAPIPCWNTRVAKPNAPPTVRTLLSAATKALEQAGFKLIAAGLTYCLEHPDDAAADGYPLDAVERMFLKLA